MRLVLEGEREREQIVGEVLESKYISRVVEEEKPYGVEGGAGQWIYSPKSIDDFKTNGE